MNKVTQGYSNIPAGHIASIVTCLEMLENPITNHVHLPEGFSLSLYHSNDLDEYRNLFRLVGTDWLWFSRLLMCDEQLAKILQEPTREIYVIRYADEDIGLLELDFGVAGDAELVFLGLTSEVGGKGIGRAIMDTATSLAWQKPIKRFWMRIIKGRNYWQLLSIILMFMIFLGLHYFFIVYPKNTEKARLAIGKEILMASYWQNLSYKHVLYKTLLKQNVPLNPINDDEWVVSIRSNWRWGKIDIN